MPQPNRQQRRHPERFAPKPLERGGVVVAYLHPGECAGGFVDSLTGLLMYDAQNQRRIVAQRGGTLALSCGPRVAEGRTQLVMGFLTEQTFLGADWLFMVDSDMTFEADAVDRLIATSIAYDAPLVGGLCFAGGRTKLYPTVYRLLRDEKGAVGVEPVDRYPRDEIIKVGATGAAALLIRRDLLQRMMAAHPAGFGTMPDGTPNPYPWFVEGHVMSDGKPMGEDIAFCVRVNALGVPIYVDTAVKFGHVKQIVLDEQTWEDRGGIVMDTAPTSGDETEVAIAVG